MSFGADLSGRGVSIRDGFLTSGQIRDLLECLDARRARGEFTAARIGTDQGLQRRADIRGDHTCWLIEPLYRAEARLLQTFEHLRLELNREAYLGLFDLELHYAKYPPGTSYSRHVDQPRGKMRRKVSVVLYLNLDWSSEAGGVLRLFEDQAQFMDVQPIAGRLVCFLTEGREHCVMPAQRERLSVTGWFRIRD